ncbi:MAG: sulfatase-like hydrolase/transferase [Lentisphaeraceae bacterium]|nr:sulfatase-like hydrolase/transferase [Lentisphaeraceae bacterium]
MLKWLSSFMALLFCVSLSAQQKRPNIVWITTEDNSACWYKLYNPKHGAPMPTIERLASHGIVFNNAYSNAPVCSAARSTIISGVYGPRTGAHFHRPQVKVKLPDGLKLFPAYLREAGYYTTNNNKQDYNYESSAIKGVWDESSKKATYKKRKKGQPFFHVQNFGSTHESQLFKDFPKNKKFITDPAKVNLFPYHPDTPTMREKYAQYLTLNNSTDAQMGKLVKQLEDEGLLDDTFIFHYGDHGGVLPGGKGYAHNDGLQVAMVVYVPKNFKHLAPAENGSRVDGFVQFVDLSATVLNLAGLDIPEQIDGKPFLGKGVSLEELNKRDTAIGYADRFDEKYDQVRFMRKGKYTYWRNYQPFNYDGLHNFYRYKQKAFVEWSELAKAGKLNEVQTAFFKAREPEQLFDIEKDPHEVNNLAKDPAYENILVEMRQAMKEKVRSLPDVSFLPETALSGCEGDVVTLLKSNKKQIAKLATIADLQLSPYPEAKAQIELALNSEDPMARYWGLIVCSSFGKTAKSFYAQAKEMAEKDPNRLVRTRAVEFLGLTGAEDPLPLLMKVLEDCKDPIEANLILNTAVLLRDGHGMKLTHEMVKNAQWSKLKGLVERRIEYLTKE